MYNKVMKQKPLYKVFKHRAYIRVGSGIFDDYYVATFMVNNTPIVMSWFGNLVNMIPVPLW